MANGTCLACHRERTGYKKQLCDDCQNPSKSWYRIHALVSVLGYGPENAIGRTDLALKLRDANPPNLARRVPYTNSLSFADIRRIVAEARKLNIPVANIDGRGYFLVGSEDDLLAASEDVDKDIQQLLDKKKALREALEHPSPILLSKRAQEGVVDGSS